MLPPHELTLMAADGLEGIGQATRGSSRGQIEITIDDERYRSTGSNRAEIYGKVLTASRWCHFGCFALWRGSAGGAASA